MNDRDAILVIEQGIRYADLRALLQKDFDPDARSATIIGGTKGEAHLAWSGCIGNRQGRVNKRTHSALIARYILRDFG